MNSATVHRLIPLLGGLLILGPLAPIAIELVRQPTRTDFEWDRLAGLLANTIALGFLTLLLTIPPALLFAFRWFDLSERNRRWTASILGLALFVPLPFLASAWQASFEKTGLIHLGLAALGVDSQEVWQPWKRGFAIAAIIHAIQLFPWAFLILAIALKSVPGAILEEMRLLGSSRATRWRLLLPQLKPALRLAAVWCLVTTSTEIVITDLTLVRTLAEEVYTQSVVGVDLARESVRALFFAVPLGLFLARSLRAFPKWGAENASADRNAYSMARTAWPFVPLPLALFLFPVVELFRRFAGRAETADINALGRNFALVWGTYWESLLWSAFNAAVTGLLCAGLALGLLNRACERRRLLSSMGVIAVFLICLPGPVLGFSAKAFFFWLSGLENSVLGREGPLQFAFYDGPAALPVIWVHIVKYLPFALALQFALLRTIPNALRESAHMEGVSDGWRLRHLTWPTVRPAFAVGFLAIALLSFGEVSAGKIVETPGSIPYSQELFNQMHTGVSTTVAAMSLIQIAALAGMYGIGVGATKLRNEWLSIFAHQRGIL